MPASARTVVSSMSLCSPPTGSSEATPGTARSPCSSYMDAISMAASVFASRIGPPYWPECTGWCNALTCTSMSVLPRSDVVREGISADQLPESATMITSESNSSLCSSMKGMKLGEPISSSPSMKTLMLTFRSSPRACNAPEWMAMPPPSSAAPRPYRRVSITVPTNGSVFHAVASGTGCTS